MQANLFEGAREDEAITIPGLHYCSGHIDKTEQQKLLYIIEQQPWLTDLKRRVQHYGY